MRNFLLALVFLFFINPAFSQTFDFEKKGNISSNEILNAYVLKKIPDFQGDVSSYFFDIDNDEIDEIVGIIKANFFYSLSGYKLVVLKKENDSWKSFRNDIYFDISKKFEVKNKKITYYHSVFYGNKKYKAKIKKNKIVTSKHFLDIFKDKKAHDIEEVTKFVQNNEHNDFALEQFHSNKQKSVNINYTNLNEKTKHYLELK